LHFQEQGDWDQRMSVWKCLPAQTKWIQKKKWQPKKKLLSIKVVAWFSIQSVWNYSMKYSEQSNLLFLYGKKPDSGGKLTGNIDTVLLKKGIGHKGHIGQIGSHLNHLTHLIRPAHRLLSYRLDLFTCFSKSPFPVLIVDYRFVKIVFSKLGPANVGKI
jgi:hypothetical protein